MFGSSTSTALRAESEYEGKGCNGCMDMRESLTRRLRGEGFPQRRRGAGKTGSGQGGKICPFDESTAESKAL